MGIKRKDITTAIMKDRGFKPCDDYRLKDIVYNIQENDLWKKFRMTEDTSYRYEKMEYNMCSTYKVFYHKEYLEVCYGNNIWHQLAWRFKEIGRQCTYAD